MSDLKISELLDGGSGNLEDQIAIARTGVNYELTLGEVKVLVLGTIETDVSNNATAITALQNDRVLRAGDTMTGNLDMGSNKITSTYVPTADADLVNRKYITDNYLPLAGGIMTGPITLNINTEPTDGYHAVSYQYVDDTYAKADGLDGYVARFTPDGNTVKISTLRDDGTTASVNEAVDGDVQFLISSALNRALKVNTTGQIGIDIVGSANTEKALEISTKITSTIAKYGIHSQVGNSTHSVCGFYNDVEAVTSASDISYGIYTNIVPPANSPVIGSRIDIIGANSNKTTGDYISIEAEGGGDVRGSHIYLKTDSGAVLQGFYSDLDSTGTSVSGKPIATSGAVSYKSDIVATVDAEILDAYAFHSNKMDGKIKDLKHIYLEESDSTYVGGTTYGIYQEGPTDINYFGADTIVGELRFDASQTVTSAEDNYVLTYDNTTGKISLEAGGDITGTVNQVAYFTGTDEIGGDPDWLWDGSNMALGAAIDDAILSKFSSATETATMLVSNSTSNSNTNALVVENINPSSGTNTAILVDSNNTSGTSYAIKITALAPASGENWGIYQDGSGYKNYFEGHTAFGAVNDTASLGDNYGIQVNGANDEAAVICVDSQSTNRNAVLQLIVDGGSTGNYAANAVLSYRVGDAETGSKVIVGMNQTATAPTIIPGNGSLRPKHNEFIIANGGQFDWADNKMMTFHTDGLYGEHQVGIGCDPSYGAVLTLGTKENEIAFVEVDTGTPSGSAVAYIKVRYGNNQSSAVDDDTALGNIGYIPIHSAVAAP